MGTLDNFVVKFKKFFLSQLNFKYFCVFFYRDELFLSLQVYYKHATSQTHVAVHVW